MLKSVLVTFLSLGQYWTAKRSRGLFLAHISRRFNSWLLGWLQGRNGTAEDRDGGKPLTLCNQKVERDKGGAWARSHPSDSAFLPGSTFK